ncbi:hypothetical protein KQI88_03085 [Alkaliphilus sp. MSJ-5]|uniref:ABC transmembrane type-1 domain-containing protein n=1 Tax=Alkaliphilus flagellatus TaxID=2841507 RepID=A0ABS6FYS6_9FIRM|nr:ABC transporter permease subunit [Alkaliphilus flagellatus]MBU5675400.1 hypothetical protein [Alkaliphilus flagellatus]
MKVSSLRNNIVFVIYGISFLLVWSWLSKVVNQSVIIPSPEEVMYSLLEILKSRPTYIVIFHTLRRVIASFIIALACALLAGIIAYLLPLVRNLLTPILYFLKVVPVVAIILLILIWSSSESAPAIVGFLMVFPLLYEGVINSLLYIDIKLLHMTKVHNVSAIYQIKDLYLPIIFRGLGNSISTSFGLAFKSVVAGEVLSHPKLSIGGAIYKEKNYLNTSGVLAWLITMVIINIILEKIMKGLGGDKNGNFKY